MIHKKFSHRFILSLLLITNIPFVINGAPAQYAVNNPSASGESTYGQPVVYERIDCELIPIPSRNSKLRSQVNIPGPFEGFYKSVQSVTESSTNWSGYVAVSDVSHPAANMVSNVNGTWLVPCIAPSTNNSYSAIWIGIDGFGSNTVEQIGTAHEYVNGIIHHYAWFEMYPGASYAISGFPVQVGDSISASVTYTHDGMFTMTLYNNTRAVSYTVPVANSTLASAQRISAEWIVEAPWSGSILPLANFGTAHFTNCTANVNCISGGIGAFPNIELIMVDTSGNMKAVPTALFADQKSFDVTWKHQ
jgi:hypothetical protein